MQQRARRLRRRDVEQVAVGAVDRRRPRRDRAAQRTPRARREPSARRPATGRARRRARRRRSRGRRPPRSRRRPAASSAAASSTTDASCIRCSSPHGVATISSSSTCAPSASDSIEATNQPSPRRPRVQYSVSEMIELAAPLRMTVAPSSVSTQSRSLAEMRTVTRSSRRALAVDEPEVLDRVHAQHVDAVVPAALGEVVEAAPPLDQQVGVEQLREARVVASRPTPAVRAAEDLLGRRHDRVGREQRIVLRRLGRAPARRDGGAPRGACAPCAPASRRT